MGEAKRRRAAGTYPTGGEQQPDVHQIGPHPVLDAFYLTKMSGEEVHLVMSCWGHDHPERDPLVAIMLCPSRAEAEAMERMARQANTPEKIARRGGVKLVDMGAKINAGLREQAEAEARRIIQREVPQGPRRALTKGRRAKAREQASGEFGNLGIFDWSGGR